MSTHLFVGAITSTSLAEDMQCRAERRRRRKNNSESSNQTPKPIRSDGLVSRFATVSEDAPVQLGRQVRILASKSLQAQDRYGVVEVAGRKASSDQARVGSKSMAPSQPLIATPATRLTADQSDPGFDRGRIVALLQASKAAFEARTRTTR
jgi:hypothetical protein